LGSLLPAAVRAPVPARLRVQEQLLLAASAAMRVPPQPVALRAVALPASPAAWIAPLAASPAASPQAHSGPWRAGAFRAPLRTGAYDRRASRARWRPALQRRAVPLPKRTEPWPTAAAPQPLVPVSVWVPVRVPVRVPVQVPMPVQAQVRVNPPKPVPWFALAPIPRRWPAWRALPRASSPPPPSRRALQATPVRPV
jgi:hypothetical protein